MADGRRRDERHGIVIVGGGLGGVAAALAVARVGGRATLLEASEQLGGQITRQGVAPLDEHALIETYGATATYRALRDGVRAHYRRHTPPGTQEAAWRNPGNGWVSRLCFEPLVGEAVLDALLADHVAHGRIELRLGTRVRTVGRRGGRVDHLDVDGPDGPVRLSVAVVLDATELGDLLPMAGAPWGTGAEAQADTGEALAPPTARPATTQAITVSAVLRRDPAPGPIVPRPSGYERWRATQPFSLDVPDAEGRPRRFGMFSAVPGGPPPFWTYRRLRDAAALGGEELALINWPANDYVDRDLVGADDRSAVVAEARALTLAFVHWLQTEAPRDDGGVGHPELQLAPDALGTADGLAAEPYVREARRLVGATTVVAEDILPDPDRGARGRWYPDAGGVGWYPMDVHAAVGAPDSRNDPTVPFQIPLSALVAAAPTNLVAAGKSMSTTHLSNGAYRVHPVEWAIGEAAGTLAAVALLTGADPRDAVVSPSTCLQVQRRLVAGGAELAWITDVPQDDPRWAGAQLLAAAGALDAPGLRHRLEVAPERRLDDADRDHVRAALARLSRAAGASSDGSGRTYGDLAQAAMATLGVSNSRSRSSFDRPAGSSSHRPDPAGPPPAPTDPTNGALSMAAPSTTSTDRVLAAIRGGLIVSCQAPPDDPLSGPEVMRRLARSVVQGGARAIRAEGLDDLRAIRDGVDVPLIGLWKDGTEGVYITPTIDHALAVVATGAELVALDATGRPRPDGHSLADTIAAVHAAGGSVLADVATLDEGLAAARAGADAVATTLAGYTPGTDDQDDVPDGEPDVGLVARLAAVATVPVIAEGRYSTAEHVQRALDAGAWAVVVGTAITRPQVLTRGLVDALAARRVES